MWWWTIDHWLLGATLALIGLGVLLSFGTSPAAAAAAGYRLPVPFRGAPVDLRRRRRRRSCWPFPSSRPKGVRRAAFFIYVVAIAAMIGLLVPGPRRQGRHALGGDRRLHPAAVRIHEARADRAGRLDVLRGPEGRGRARRLDRLWPLRRRRRPAAGRARRRPDGADHRRLRGRILDGRRADELGDGAGRRRPSPASAAPISCSSTSPAASTASSATTRPATAAGPPRRRGHRRRRPASAAARARGS